MVPRCQKCNADRRKVIIVRNGVGHVTDVELDVSGALSQCPSGDPAQQVQSSKTILLDQEMMFKKNLIKKYFLIMEKNTFEKRKNQICDHFGDSVNVWF